MQSSLLKWINLLIISWRWVLLTDRTLQLDSLWHNNFRVTHEFHFNMENVFSNPCYDIKLEGEILKNLFHLQTRVE